MVSTALPENGEIGPPGASFPPNVRPWQKYCCPSLARQTWTPGPLVSSTSYSLPGTGTAYRRSYGPTSRSVSHLKINSGGEGAIRQPVQDLVFRCHLSTSLPRPELAVQRAVADGLDDVRRAGRGAALQVGDGAGHPQDAVV